MLDKTSEKKRRWTLNEKKKKTVKNRKIELFSVKNIVCMLSIE